MEILFDSTFLPDFFCEKKKCIKFELTGLFEGFCGHIVSIYVLLRCIRIKQGGLGLITVDLIES